MIKTTEPDEENVQKMVQPKHPELKRTSEVSAHTDIGDQSNQQTSKTADEQGLIHAEPNALLRWEDDGGLPT